MNLRKQVEPLKISRASGFLATEACTPRGVATHLGKTLAQTSLPPSQTKQEEGILLGRRRLFKEQNRSGFRVRGSECWVLRRVLGSGFRVRRWVLFWVLGSEC